ncbi:MAG TPA: ABC transporter substrate-binding protein [Stellaceae bacterium]|nr:ABC transporter substrate-binding protein [Stellaceae bacterium]
MKSRFAGILALAMLCTAGNAMAEPYSLRVGRGVAAEEQLWLMAALPSVTPNQGKVYKIDMTEFRGVDTRFQAFEAGQLDLATTSTEAALFAAEKGMKFKIVASISEEALPGFVTQFMVLDNSPIHALADLKGKIIGTNAARSSIEFWARGAVKSAGLNPDRDVRWAVVPFPAQEEAVRSGKLDVGAFPQPFAANVKAHGGMRTVFTSKVAVPFAEDLQVLIASAEIMEKHADVLRAFMSDYARANTFYHEHPKEAKQALIDAKIVLIPPQIYLNMEDNLRDPNGRPNLDTMNRLADLLVADHYLDRKVDAASIVDMSYLPK